MPGLFLVGLAAARIRVTVRPRLPHNQTYKKIDLVGSSTTSLTDAIESAIARASKTTRNLDWFEVEEIRGQIKDGKVAHYQVSMLVRFRIED